MKPMSRVAPGGGVAGRLLAREGAALGAVAAGVLALSLTGHGLTANAQDLAPEVARVNASFDARACIPRLTYHALDPQVAGYDSSGQAAALGTYERISPDGRFVLRSYSGEKLGKVSLIELPAQPGGALRAVMTPFSNEAFPVQGSWRYLVDINGDHYRLSDVLRQQTRARPLFRGGMTGFYAAASEMPLDQGFWPYIGVDTAAPTIENIANQDLRTIFIRSLSWPTGGPEGGVGPLQMRTIAVRDDGVSARIVQDSGSQFICTQRSAEDGDVYALPMISVDGTEFAAIPQNPRAGQPSMRIYGVAAEPMRQEHPCALKTDLGYAPGKAVFGFAASDARPAGEASAQQALPAMLTFMDRGLVYFVDRRLGRDSQPMMLDRDMDDQLASAFAGITRDGRIIYAASWKTCAGARCKPVNGYVVADPYQSTEYRNHWARRGQMPPKTCITQAEVTRIRQVFANFHHMGQ